MLSLTKALVLRFRLALGHIAQETGIALEQHGSRLTKDIAYLEPLNRHRNLQPIFDSLPRLAQGSYVSANCSLVGEVFLGAGSAVSYGASLRGDNQPVRLGDNVFVGEHTTITNAHNLPVGVPLSTNIGHHVSIGAMCSLSSCTIDDQVVLGHKVVVAEGACIMRGAQIGNNSYVPAGVEVPSNQLWAGSPVQFVRDLTAQEIQQAVLANQQNLAEIKSHFTDIEEDKLIA